MEYLFLNFPIMVYEYKTTTFKVKRIHNIRDFSYRVEGNINLTDLALLLNTLSSEAFFWTEGELLHSTSDIDWLALLPQELRGEIKNSQMVKEGYLAQGELSRYAAFALFAADFNKVLSSNFKANPLFRKLRRRTKEGWDLSRWLKFLHELGLNQKAQKEGIEYQVWRWFSLSPDGFEYLTLSLKGGVAINLPLKELLEKFTPEVLKKHFAFRIKGTYRVGRLEEIKDQEATLLFDGGFKSDVPIEKLFPIYLPSEKDWREKDRLGLLKRLRIRPNTFCRYYNTLLEAVNQLLEPFMVKLQEANPRWDRVEVSPYVVVDKPVPQSEVIDYIFEERKVYNAPFEELKINLVDLVLKSEKNKKLLRDAKNDLIENLRLFLEDIGVKSSFGELTFPQKVKRWDLSVLPLLEEFLKENLESLKEASFNIVLIPQGEFLSEDIFALPLLESLKKALKGVKYRFITDKEVKTFYKSKKAQTKRKILFPLLKELFKTNGGSLFILDEPLPFGKVAVETQRGYEIYNLFGELLEIAPSYEPKEEELLITFNGKAKKNVVLLDRWVTPPIVKESLEERVCLNGERGLYIDLLKSRTYASISGKTPFELLQGWGISLGENVEPSQALKALLQMSKVAELGV